MVTRAEIEKTYKVNNGVIQSPGKFEGESIYTPYFWELLLEGWGESNGHGEWVFDIEKEDKEQFSELEKYTKAYLTLTDVGFVYCVVK